MSNENNIKLVIAVNSKVSFKGSAWMLKRSLRKR